MTDKLKDISDDVKNAFEQLGEFSYQTLPGIQGQEHGVLHYTLNFAVDHKKRLDRWGKWWNSDKGKDYMKDLDSRLHTKLPEERRPNERKIGYCSLIYRYSDAHVEIHIIDSTLDRRKEKYERRQEERRK